MDLIYCISSYFCVAFNFAFLNNYVFVKINWTHIALWKFQNLTILKNILSTKREQYIYFKKININKEIRYKD